MNQSKHIYRLEVVSHSPFIGQMNVYLCIASFDNPGQKAVTVLYHALKPATPHQTASIESEEPARSVTVSIYVVPHEYPQSNTVADSPDFLLEYRILKDGQIIESRDLRINRWGGTQLVNIPYR